MDLRALVVDDEQLAREELCFQLEQLDGVVVVGQAGNGFEALESVERLKPDLVFLDVQMPGLTGFEVARRLLDRLRPAERPVARGARRGPSPVGRRRTGHATRADGLRESGPNRARPAAIASGSESEAVEPA